MKKLTSIVRVNPLAHHVYKGRIQLFRKIAPTEVYDTSTTLKYLMIPVQYEGVQHHPLPFKYALSLGKTNFINIYEASAISGNIDSDVVILGDIFTNSLCWTYRKGRRMYYTEFFTKRSDSFLKKILFQTIALFFLKRKIIVPTKQALETRKKVTPKVFYLPQLYTGKIGVNNTLDNPQPRILFVGNIDDRKKNVHVLIKAFLELKKKHPKAILTLAGNMKQKDYLDVYSSHSASGDIQLLGLIPHDKLVDVYTRHNIFVLPSIVDPIGAVVLEAMANELPVIVSKNSGSASYVCHGENGFVFDTPDQLKEYLNRLCDDSHLRKTFGKISGERVWSVHALTNPIVLQQRKHDFKKFLEMK